MSSIIETHIVGTRLDERRLAAVLPSEVQVWAAVLALSTLRNLVSLLRSIYASAVLDRLVGASPVVRIVLSTHEHDRVVPMTVDPVRALPDGMTGLNRAMVLTQEGLVCASGELLALRVQDVDFLRRTARLVDQIAPGAKVRSVPKTPRSRRMVPLPRMVANALAAHRRVPPLDDGTLFTTRFGSATATPTTER